MKIIKWMITIIQMLILVPVIVLQYLADKKMGVMRYLTFKRYTFEREIFTDNVMLVIKVGLIVLTAIALLAFLYQLKQKAVKCKNLMEISIIGILATSFVCTGYFEDFLAYHFFLIAIGVVIIGALLKLALAVFMRK